MIISNVKHLQSDTYELTVIRNDQSVIHLEVDEGTIATLGLLKGKELTENEFVSMLKVREIQKLYSRAINYLSRQRRTYFEVYAYLQKEETDEFLIKQALEKLVEQNYINDSDFANDYTQTAYKVSYKGPILIKNELTQKGIEGKLITASLQKYSKESQLNCARKWIQKKEESFKKYSFTEKTLKIKQLLMRKGFTGEIISIALEEFTTEQKDTEETIDNEWINLQATAEKYARKYDKFDDYTKKQKLFAALARKGFSFELIEEYLSKKE